MSVPIAYVAPEFPVQTQTFVYREVRALRQRGWKVVPVSLHPSQSDHLSGFDDLRAGTIEVYGSARTSTLKAAAGEMIRRPLRSVGTFLLALRDAIAPGESTGLSQRLKLLPQAIAGIGLAVKLRRLKVGHIHAHFAHSSASVAMYAAKQMGIAFSFTGHANDLFQRRALLRRKLERAAFVACISRWHEAFYRSIAPAATVEYRVIRCGVDVEGWTPRGHERVDPQASFRVLTVCRLIEKKGVDLLIRALGEMNQIPWHLTIAGDGPDREKLETLAGQIGCSDRIDWLGMVSNDKIPALLEKADVFALPCRTDSAGDRDGIPVVLMEAMACGIPVISGDLPAIRELIENGQSGILIADPQTAAGLSALADSLCTLTRDVGMRARLSQAARRRVEDEFSISSNIKRLEESLRSTRAAIVRANDARSGSYRVL